MNIDNTLIQAVVVAGVIFLLILWICLPFAVFGVKRRLDRIIRLLEQQQVAQRTERSTDSEPFVSRSLR
ncbi:hypothetical protein ACLRAE_19635 [Bordetella bronchiseptica]|uniref:N-acetyltransferase YedL n=1 Tax=Bordetella bronchiseptica 00-P-2796 TaxID=1331199 RepID=A0ABR4R9H5_BORBO|nr:hypothetical protein [Bordetella bronchiseptica]SHT49610.1 Uncharacterised protein [Mycobacteroides abscessus subsp. abscessus]KCV32203.1 hypothetical protein L490_2004 [Bordetella bronchiseptica 00-P-2796]KDB85222.1 hypothetical protein L495_3620 [Bordetella bronchiseptica CARE970018BB]KDC19038.1 hypothetical protein L542_3656 [Bordetella bronchiseptica F-1]KDC26308.1 hypothetical protein L504_3678 [Bordetella bronchiseptica F2]